MEIHQMRMENATLMNQSLGEAINGRQRALDRQFQAAARAWKDVYLRDDLSGQIHRGRQAEALAFVSKLGLPPGARVLEAGCGAGLMAAALAKRDFRVTAIDTVAEMLEITWRTAVEAGVKDRVELHRMDVHQMGFGDGQFDVAMAIGVVPWSTRPESAIRELARVVRQGGYLVLSADNLWCLHHVLDPSCFPPLRPLRRKVAELLDGWFIRASSAPRPRYQYHSIRQVDAMLLRAGLEKIKGTTVGFGPFSLFRWRLLPDSAGRKVCTRLQRLAGRGVPLIRSTGVEYLVLCRKTLVGGGKEN